MRNLLLTLRFDGSHFHGWQIQPNAVTVQQVIGEAVESITGSKTAITGCSRTDAGVHADMFCCNMRTETYLSCERLQSALNAVLPFSVAVTDCREVPLDFHARYDCVSKQYKYIIWNNRVRNPFLVNYAYHYNRPLDAELLNEQARAYIGEHDFSSFCASGASTVSSVRKIYASSVIRDEDKVIFTVCGNGFLYNMVRIMAGTLLEISSGKIEYDTIGDIIGSLSRENAGITAPACGLYLNRVNYDKTKVGECDG